MTDRDKQNERLKLFVSYARKDMAAADRLVAALDEAGFDVLIDRRDLPYGEAWQGELGDFIRESDAVVWLVSESSVHSRWCNWELGEVERLNKRLVPVAIESVPPDSLPEALGRIQVLPASGGFDFDTHLPVLIETLSTDRGWLKEHTRLADRARQWLARDRSAALLLRGVALKDAQNWADAKPTAAPMPSDEVLLLLLASRRAQGRRQRLAATVSVLAAVAGIGLAGLAYWQRGVAVEQRQIAEQRAVAERAAKEEAQRNLKTAKTTMDDVVFDIAQGLRDVEGMRLANLREILTTVETAMDRLRDSAPNDPELQHSRAAMLAEFGNTYFAAGGAALALKEYKASLAIVERLAAADPGNVNWQGDIAVSRLKIGDVLVAEGDLAGALRDFKDCLAIRKRLVASDSGNAGWQHGLSTCEDRIGDVLVDENDLAGAQKMYEESLAIAERLVAADPGKTEWQRDLSVSHQKIGDLLAKRGDSSGARSHDEESLKISERLAAADPGNTQAQRDLSVSEILVGDAQMKIGDFVAALASYQASLAVAERLAASDPGKSEWQRDLSVSHNKIGDARRAADDLTGALADYEAGLQIRERLAARDPNNAGWQADIVVSLSKIASVSDPQRRVKAVKRALAILDDMKKRGTLAPEQWQWPDILRALLVKSLAR